MIRFIPLLFLAALHVYAVLWSTSEHEASELLFGRKRSSISAGNARLFRRANKRTNSQSPTASRRTSSPEATAKKQKLDGDTPTLPKDKSPSPRVSPEASPIWDGRGFSHSRSPSSWGSGHASPGGRPTETRTWMHGPAIFRGRTTESGKRDFQRVPTRNSIYRSMTNRIKSQSAVHVLNDNGHAGMTAYGKRTMITVDARQSSLGGWAGMLTESGQTTEVQHARPGEKIDLPVWSDEEGKPRGGRGFIMGKGTVKATVTNVLGTGFSVSSRDPSDISDRANSRSTGSRSRGTVQSAGSQNL